MFGAQPSKALYYPHFAFGSVGWVKTALLYWEGVVRQDPLEIDPHDEPEIRQLADAGLIEDLEPDLFEQRLVVEFGERLEELLNANGGRFPPSSPVPRELRGSPPERQATIRKRVTEELEARGLHAAARATATMLGETLGLFVTMLACKIARERAVAPVTDDPTFDALVTFVGHQRIVAHPEEAAEVEAQAAAQLWLPMLSAEGIEKLPVARLIEVREAFATQRRRYRENVAAQVEAIATLPTLEAIQLRLEVLRRESREDLETSRRALAKAKVTERWSLVGLSAPTSIAAGAALAGAPALVVGPVGGVAALAAGTTTWFMRRRKKATDPGSRYLLSIDETMARASKRGVADVLHDLVPR